MMGQRSDVLTNLLLATAALHGLRGVERVSPHFKAVWHSAVRGEAPERKAVTADVARGLLCDVLDICAAHGVERLDLVSDFNNHNALFEGDPVEALSRRLLDLIVER
jgi:hypothetical protein